MTEPEFETVGDEVEEWEEDWEEVEGDEEEFEDDEVEAAAEPTTASPSDDGEFQIESDKPMPKSHGRKYPFHKMQPGDSFEVKVNPAVIEERGLTEAVRLQRSALSSSASSFNKRNKDRRMVVRKTGPTSLRCWCVEPE